MKNRISILTLLVTTTMTAEADCPSPYSAADGVMCNSTCTYDGGTDTWTCAIDNFGSVTMVTDYDTTLNDYEAWGDDGGTKFCCIMEPTINTPVSDLVIDGSIYVDTLKFTYETGLNNLFSADGASITATINGDGSSAAYGGNDIIKGSNEASSIYIEHLFGNRGDDVIIAQGGDDYLYGEHGNDTLTGGSGDDYLEGGDHNDTLLGGAGFDYLYGQAGTDSMGGGDDDDYLDGGTDTDYICGDDGADELYDGDSSAILNYLWGGINFADQATIDYTYCSNSISEYEGYSAGTCITNPVISPSVRPANCP